MSFLEKNFIKKFLVECTLTPYIILNFYLKLNDFSGPPDKEKSVRDTVDLGLEIFYFNLLTLFHLNRII